jgi:hypothetical protein
METKDILLYILIFAAAGFSLYRRYVKKNQQGKGGRSNTSGSMPVQSSKDDDYEPYSGR